MKRIIGFALMCALVAGGASSCQKSEVAEELSASYRDGSVYVVLEDEAGGSLLDDAAALPEVTLYSALRGSTVRPTLEEGASGKRLHLSVDLPLAKELDPAARAAGVGYRQELGSPFRLSVSGQELECNAIFVYSVEQGEGMLGRDALRVERIEVGERRMGQTLTLVRSADGRFRLK